MSYTAEQMERVQKVSYNEGLKRASEIARNFEEEMYFKKEDDIEYVIKVREIHRKAIAKAIKEEIL